MHVLVAQYGVWWLDLFVEARLARNGTYSKQMLTDSTGLIICDPPVKVILTDYSRNQGFEVQTSPYQNGYVDFVDQQAQVECGRQPSRSSFMDDMGFYLLNHSKLVDLTCPKPLRVFMEKLVASHFLKLSSFMQSNMELLQWNLSRHQNLTGFDISAAEEQWSDVQSWHRRIAEYQDDLLGIMAQLQVPRESPAAITESQQAQWKDPEVDYQFLYQRFNDISRRLSDLSSSIAALASIAGNRAAFRTQDLTLQAAERAGQEAKSVKALTVLGFIFVPLTFVSSVFSMSSPYGPGGQMFWLYFAVSLTSLGAVILGYFVLQGGYGVQHLLVGRSARCARECLVYFQRHRELDTAD